MFEMYNDRPCQPAIDPVLSRKLDELIIALETEQCPLRRSILKLLKRWFERQVPAYYPAHSQMEAKP